MVKKDKHEWKPPSWLKEHVASTAWFHDKEVEVYEGITEINGIRLWRENYRTMLDLDHIRRILKKDLDEITDDEIIEHILSHHLHKIPELAKSIKFNGVRVPLILSHKKKLIDGNRRFLACKYLLGKESKPDHKFTIVPVKCVDPKISDETELKVISEMNFLPQHKEEWPRYVRAQFALQEYENALKKSKNEKEAYKHVNYLLDIPPSDLKRFREVLKMINEYVKYAEANKQKTRQDAEIFGRSKFQFFEELYNKAESIDKSVKELFFRYLCNKEITSITKVREFTKVMRYTPARKHLEKKNGSFELATSLYSSPRKALTKITQFCEWLENLSQAERDSISDDLRKRLTGTVQKLSKD